MCQKQWSRRSGCWRCHQTHSSRHGSCERWTHWRVASWQRYWRRLCSVLKEGHVKEHSCRCQYQRSSHLLGDKDSSCFLPSILLHVAVFAQGVLVHSCLLIYTFHTGKMATNKLTQNALLTSKQQSKDDSELVYSMTQNVLHHGSGD